jgi:hypothetical protein
MELLFGIYGPCFLAVGDILWAYFVFGRIPATFNAAKRLESSIL